jgi:hypothetical protein
MRQWHTPAGNRSRSKGSGSLSSGAEKLVAQGQIPGSPSKCSGATVTLDQVFILQHYNEKE